MEMPILRPYSNEISERLTARQERCKSLAGDLRNKNVLDIGCSLGWFEEYAIRSESNLITGIDPSCKILLTALQSVPAACFGAGDALHLPFRDHFFDLVIMFDVIEHIPKGTEAFALAEVRRVLKPNGIFVLSTPLWDWRSNLLLRPAYFPHWRDFIKQPHLAAGMFFLRLCEGISGAAGVVWGYFKDGPKNGRKAARGGDNKHL
jgi:SAM-dependent methyltransferase